ncbi:MAG TPA: TlpA disulfide reductase family protein [Pyrinomonadaceae bacterium]|nr:TlpA disulfide reductase family protein [Pyrinomonadaceae bacterium]
MDTIESGKKILPGSVLPPLQATLLGGGQTSLSYADSKLPTVIYVFSTSCGWCERNLDNINFLASNLKNNYRFVGLDIDRDVGQLATYATETKLAFPIYHSPTPATWSQYKLGGTPMTIVVSSDGKVLEDWSGAYAEATRLQVESFFGTKLPGILPVSSDGSKETIQ